VDDAAGDGDGHAATADGEGLVLSDEDGGDEATEDDVVAPLAAGAHAEGEVVVGVESDPQAENVAIAAIEVRPSRRCFMASACTRSLNRP